MKDNKTPKTKQPFIKTKVKPDNSVEVEMRNPINSKLGKIIIWILIAGMTVLGLFGLIMLMIEVGSNM